MCDSIPFLASRPKTCAHTHKGRRRSRTGVGIERCSICLFDQLPFEKDSMK
jgi:hypothetical protein